MALADSTVLSVSCGSWHSAAIAAPRPLHTPNGTQSAAMSSAPVTPRGSAKRPPPLPTLLPSSLPHQHQQQQQQQRREINFSDTAINILLMQHQQHLVDESSHIFESPAHEEAMYNGGASGDEDGQFSPEGGAAMNPELSMPSYHAQIVPGSMLYTWGGAFDWQEPSRASAAHALRTKTPSRSSRSTKDPQQVPDVRDTHQGCLGTGDVLGQLLPQAVEGPWARAALKQVRAQAHVTKCT